MMPRDPLAVEVLAGDDDDAAALEVEVAGEDAAVPEGVDRLPARARDRVDVLGATDLPRPASTPSARSSG